MLLDDTSCALGGGASRRSPRCMRANRLFNRRLQSLPTPSISRDTEGLPTSRRLAIEVDHWLDRLQPLRQQLSILQSVHSGGTHFDSFRSFHFELFSQRHSQFIGDPWNVWQKKSVRVPTQNEDGIRRSVLCRCQQALRRPTAQTGTWR